MSAQVPARIRQLNANSFTHANALPAGAVLIVGSGASGVQIAEDLLANGRDTYLCVGQHKRLPRSFKGRDIMDWMEELGMTYELVRERPEIDHSPLLTGVDGGYDVDLRQFDKQGGHLLGRLEAVHGDELILGADLLRDIANADESYYQTLNMLAARVAEQQGSAAPTPLSPPAQGMPAPSPASVNLTSAGITSIIWATGYGLDFSWVSCGEFNNDGTPKQERGVSTVPGLYFLGLPFMHNARSSFFWGVGEDAEYVAQHLAQNRATAA